MQPMNSSIPLLSLDQRKALLWVKARQPTDFPSVRDKTAPTFALMFSLIRLGLIQMDPNRRQYDSPRFCLTERAETALGASQ